MLAWRIEGSKIGPTVEIQCLKHLLAGKINLYSRHLEKKYNSIHEALKKVETLILYYRKNDTDITRAYYGQEVDYKTFLKLAKPMTPNIETYKDTKPNTRPELIKAMQFLRKNHKNAAILLRIDCLVDDDMPIDERKILLLFKRKDIVVLENLFPTEVQAERNKRRSQTLKKTLKDQSKAPSQEILINRERARAKGAFSNRLNAITRDEQHLEMIFELYSKGLGLTAIANELNNQSQDKRWYPIQVSRVLKRFERSTSLK